MSPGGSSSMGSAGGSSKERAHGPARHAVMRGLSVADSASLSDSGIRVAPALMQSTPATASTPATEPTPATASRRSHRLRSIASIPATNASSPAAPEVPASPSSPAPPGLREPTASGDPISSGNSIGPDDPNNAGDHFEPSTSTPATPSTRANTSRPAAPEAPASPSSPAPLGPHFLRRPKSIPATPCAPTTQSTPATTPTPAGKSIPAVFMIVRNGGAVAMAAGVAVGADHATMRIPLNVGVVAAARSGARVHPRGGETSKLCRPLMNILPRPAGATGCHSVAGRLVRRPRGALGSLGGRRARTQMAIGTPPGTIRGPFRGRKRRRRAQLRTDVTHDTNTEHGFPAERSRKVSLPQRPKLERALFEQSFQTRQALPHKTPAGDSTSIARKDMDTSSHDTTSAGNAAPRTQPRPHT